jgi:translation elongation factor EF-1beta
LQRTGRTRTATIVQYRPFLSHRRNYPAFSFLRSLLDLETLAQTILSSTKVDVEGRGDVEFTGKFRLDSIGYGIKKLVLLATAESMEAGEATAELIADIWEEEIQSVDVEEGGQGRMEGWGAFKEIGFLE